MRSVNHEIMPLQTCLWVRTLEADNDVIRERRCYWPSEYGGRK